MVRKVREATAAPSTISSAQQPICHSIEGGQLPIRSRCLTTTPAATQSASTRDEPKDPSPKPKTTTIYAAILIPGDGDPIHKAALVIENKLITYVGPSSDLPFEYTTASSSNKHISVPFLMPGLWDCHVHFGGVSEKANDYAAFVSTHPASAGSRIARAVWETLQAGYTSVRDVAGVGAEIVPAIEEGVIAGPNIYGAGAAISQTAGHGDMFSLPAGDVLLNNGAGHIVPGHYGAGHSIMADGVDECRRAVRLQIRRKAKVIKVFASGGVLSRDDDPTCQQFSDEELAVIVDEAARQKRIVAAHVHGKPGILAAIRAGCKTLEHCSYADEEVMALMKEKGIIYIATRAIIEAGLKRKGEGMAPESWAKMQMVEASHMEAYNLAIKSGVQIALGTDYGGNLPTEDVAMGKNAIELEWAVVAGMTPLEAIKAATAMGPLTLGPQAPKSGQLKKGYEADVIALKVSPLEDVKVLQEKKNVTYVWKGGKLFKGPGVGPWGEDWD